jgi:hypothetical protein
MAVKEQQLFANPLVDMQAQTSPSERQKSCGFSYVPYIRYSGSHDVCESPMSGLSLLRVYNTHYLTFPDALVTLFT